MAVYCITYSSTNDWNEDPREHFSTRAAANERVEEVRATGRFARLIRWENDRPVKEVLIINESARPDGAA